MNNSNNIKIKEITGDSLIDLVLDTIRLEKQCIIFVNTKRSAEKLAEDISKKIKDIKTLEIAENALNVLSTPTKQCKRLHFCLLKGIAFHHSGLLQKQRTLIEENFDGSKINVICATPTLAYGLDLPAYRVIIRDVKRFGRRGMEYIPVLEYLQMCGRAGRPGKETKGEAICITKDESEKYNIVEKFVLGNPEEIYSKLAVEPVLRMYVLSLISTEIVRNKEELLNFFEKTFWGHQFGDMAKLSDIIDKMLNLLEGYKFIISSDVDKLKKTNNEKENDNFKTDDLFTSANEIGSNNEKMNTKSVKYRATLVGRRVSQLYLDPYTANKLLNAIEKSNSNTSTFAYLHLLSSTLEMRPLIRARKKDEDIIQELLIKFEDNFLEKPPAVYDYEYDEYLDATKTAHFFNLWIDEIKEDKILEEYGIQPGLIKVKLDIIDWLIYSLIDLCKLLNYNDKINPLTKLRLRLNYGVKEELLPLLKLKGIGRIRARKLYNNGIKDIGDIKDSDPTTLAGFVGDKLALDIKKQVGQEIKEIPKGKRVGQLSIEKFR